MKRKGFTTQELGPGGRTISPNSSATSVRGGGGGRADFCPHLAPNDAIARLMGSDVRKDVDG